MPGTAEFSEIFFSLSDLIVASYSKTAGTYGTPGSVLNGQMLDVQFEADADELRGYGVIVALLRVTTGAKITLNTGSYDFSTLAAVAGVSNSTSGTTPNQVRSTKINAGGSGLPYFGVIGTAPTDDGGLAVIGLRCCKLDNFPKFTMDGTANKFQLSEASGKAIPILVSTTYELAKVKTYETASGWTAPTTDSEFLAFFA